MEKRTRSLLQLFAEEGQTGENAAVPGQQRLLDLGVPAGVLEKRAESRGQDAAAREGEQRRMSWEEIMADPEYNSRMQAVVRSRLKDARQSQAALEKLTPGLEALARQEAMDPERLDYDALAGALEKKFRQDTQRDRIRSHFEDLQRQAAELRKQFPDFDLSAQLQDPAFLRMTAPGTGISLENAYFALNRDALQSAAMELAAKKTAELISNNIRATGRRPQENGLSAQAPSVSTFDYRNASPRQRADLKKRILEASAQGRKLYPNT